MPTEPPIYLDHAATTPLRTAVREAMAPYLDERFGNPSSTHRWGRETAVALDRARERVAAALGARPREVIFVRGGTESDNLAVLGRARAVRTTGEPAPCVVHSALEHSAVREAAGAVEAEGGRRRVVPVDRNGVLDLDRLGEILSGERGVAVVSVMWVSNEVGTLLPVGEALERARAAGVPLHSDAVQAVGKVAVDLRETPVDLLTVTGHKLGGPRGTAVLIVREGVELRPLHHGGGQERGLRPGTPDVAGAVGMAEAVARAVEERETEGPRLATLRDRLASGLAHGIPGLRVHGEGGPRAPHILSVGVPGVDGRALPRALDLEGVAASRGSACSSGSARPGPALRALLGDDGPEAAPLRLSLGHTTTEAEVERAIPVVVEVVTRLRRLSGAAATAGAPPRG